MRLQRDDGGWCTQMIQQAHYDSTATAIFAWYLFKLYNITGDNCYAMSGLRGLDSLRSATRSDGMIEFAEGDCHGCGRYSSKYSVSPLAQGMTVLAIQEMRKAGL